ncbi:MAG: hypothetical protein ACI8QC_001202 [Planctomycetota bacterium]|jgi:hypothetical protein
MSAPLHCESVHELFSEHLSGRLKSAVVAELRTHLAGCEDCRAAFMAAGEERASVGAERRHERQEVERQMEDLRSEHAKQEEPPSARRARLRAVIYPALLAGLLIVVKVRAGKGGPQLLAHAGQVVVDALPIDLDGEPGQLVPGRYCATGPDGHAEISTKRGQAEMGAQTAVSYQGQRPLRLRLDRGELQVRGEARIQVQGSMLVLEDGILLVIVSPSGAQAECLEGEVQVINPNGSSTLHTGESLTLERPQ